MPTPPKPRRGRPPGSTTIPPGAVIWSKRLTPAEIAAVMKLVNRMRKVKP
jgi:hypothetical protein